MTSTRIGRFAKHHSGHKMGCMLASANVLTFSAGLCCPTQLLRRTLTKTRRQKHQALRVREVPMENSAKKDKLYLLAAIIVAVLMILFWVNIDTIYRWSKGL